MENLIFQLQGSLSSWGEVAVGEYRPTAQYPSQSAIQGLMGAAFGIERDDEEAQSALRISYRMAVGVLSQGRLLRDYHTAQVPSRSDLKKRPHSTRRDELSLPKHELNTILSTRDYCQDASSLIAIQVRDGALYSLAQLVSAIKNPKFILYLGRKSCPIELPLHPCILNTDTVLSAFIEYQNQLSELWKNNLPDNLTPDSLTIQKIAWSDDFGADDLNTMGMKKDFSIVRKDQVITRRGWQFADRREHIALLSKE